MGTKRGERVISICPICKKQSVCLPSRIKKYCSYSCSLFATKKGNKNCVGRILSDKTKEKIGLKQIGRIHSTDERKKKSIAAKKMWKRHKETGYYDKVVEKMKDGMALNMRLNARFNKESSIERKTREYLDNHNILFLKQFKYELGIADFWLPETNTIVECDGDYWHSRPEVIERDKKHNKYFQDSGFNVIRISETEINSNDYSKLNNIEKIQNAL